MKLSDLIRKLFPSYVSKKELKEKLEYCSKDLAMTIDELREVKNENAALVKDIKLLTDLNNIHILSVEKEICSEFLYSNVADGFFKKKFAEEVALRIYEIMDMKQKHIREKKSYLIEGHVYLLNSKASAELDNSDKHFEEL